MQFISQNANFQELISEKLKGQHFMKHNHFVLSDIQEGKGISQLLIEQIHLQQDGILHGGVISTLCDVTMGFAAFSLVEKGVKVVTSNLSVNFLKPNQPSIFRVEGSVVKPGRNLFFCEAIGLNYQDDQWVETVRASSTMSLIKK